MHLAPEPSEANPLPYLHISRWALAFVAAHGGHLYLWTKPAGADYVTISASPYCPPDVHFPDAVERDGVAIFIEDEFPTDFVLTVKLRRFPRTGLVVHTGSLPGGGWAPGPS